MLKYIIRNNKPEILVITPLFTGHKVSKETKKTLRRNTIPFEWVTYMGTGNPCKNAQIAFNAYRKSKDLPPFVIKIDNDLDTKRGMLDEMYSTLTNAPDMVSYCYCGFEFKGHINLKMPAREFNADMLKKSNYISSCSLMNTKRFIEIGMWVTDDRGFRLLDWATWLKFLKRGYIGVPNYKTWFVANAKKDSVSCRDAEDYHKKAKWVLENYG